MFTGIIEQTGAVLSLEKDNLNTCILIEKPSDFNDLKVGDSVCTSGVCLTVERFDEQTMQFTLGPETLKITGWDCKLVKGLRLNLERSLKLGDRVHGHLVTGHVDGLGKVVDVETQGGSLFLAIQIPWNFKKFVWKKGSICISGVSLTVNDVEGDVVDFCLIPETLKKTNLSNLNVGDDVNLEFDYMAKAIIHSRELSV